MRHPGLYVYLFRGHYTSDRVLGALSLFAFRGSAFTENDVDLLCTIGEIVTVIVENSLRDHPVNESGEGLREERIFNENERSQGSRFAGIVGKSSGLKHVLGQVETVAATDATVLLLGETGVGKDLIAKAIHNLSPRREHRFVRADCAAVPVGLLESELFGHEKGAFTEASTPRIGRFELVNKGTLFLDEIGDIPLELQCKSLRVLEEREFERLGSVRTVGVDCRMIAATNRDLAQMIKEQKFRSDLFYRLNVFPIYVPPLRERREDIPLLVDCRREW